MENQQRTIKEMLGYIKMRPGMYLGERDGRADYLFYFLEGWFEHHGDGIIGRYHEGIAHWIYEWIGKDKKRETSTVEFTFNWYKMIYSITSTEEEAWELFFRISNEYIEQLETEDNRD